MMNMQKKLAVKPGFKLLVLGAPEGYLEQLGDLPEGATLSTTLVDQDYDLVQLFVRSRAEVDARVSAAMAALRRGGYLWLTYPKKSSKVQTDITRDVGWESVYAVGWRPVTQIAIDDTWSALRFRPEAEVGTAARG